MKSLKQRHAKEIRFRLYGLFAIAFALSILFLLFGGILVEGYQGIYRAEVKRAIKLDPEENVFDQLDKNFSDLEHRLLSPAAPLELHRFLNKHPEKWGQTVDIWFPLYGTVDLHIKDKADLKPYKKEVLKKWLEEDIVKLNFHKDFFFSGDSQESEFAGIGGAIMGTFYVLAITLFLAFPIGIGAAIYLEEFAKQGKLLRFIELNINNLASVPSIIFGLLGLIVYINLISLPRSSALVGGMTLTLLTVPIIVIAARAALQSVPNSIRRGALALGASPVQTTFHHVLPSAMPGILTGTILGMSRALGESAPLLIVGMAAFIVDIPATPLEPATTLPVQIFSWVRSPEPGFVEKAAAAILVLLGFLFMMNISAIILRKKFDRRG